MWQGNIELPVSDEQLRASDQVIGLCIPEESRRDEQGRSVNSPETGCWE
jgi:hypothetical protein